MKKLACVVLLCTVLIFFFEILFFLELEREYFHISSKDIYFREIKNIYNYISSVQSLYKDTTQMANDLKSTFPELQLNVIYNSRSKLVMQSKKISAKLHCFDIWIFFHKNLKKTVFFVTARDFDNNTFTLFPCDIFNINDFFEAEGGLMTYGNSDEKHQR